MREWQENKNAVLQATSTVVAVVCVLYANAPLAQEAESSDTIDEIVVTGSRIPRRDFTTPSPLTTVDDVEIRLPVRIKRRIHAQHTAQVASESTVQIRQLDADRPKTEAVNLTHDALDLWRLLEAVVRMHGPVCLD